MQNPLISPRKSVQYRQQDIHKNQKIRSIFTVIFRCLSRVMVAWDHDRCCGPCMALAVRKGCPGGVDPHKLSKCR